MPSARKGMIIMKIKKLLALAVTFVLAVGLAACGSTGGDGSSGKGEISVFYYKNIEKNKPAQATAPANAPAAAPADANKQEIIAASCAVIAEELGTDASNIKVTSFKKL